MYILQFQYLNPNVRWVVPPFLRVSHEIRATEAAFQPCPDLVAPWRFPEMEVPPNHPLLLYGYPHFRSPPSTVLVSTVIPNLLNQIPTAGAWQHGGHRLPEPGHGQRLPKAGREMGTTPGNRTLPGLKWRFGGKNL